MYHRETCEMVYHGVTGILWHSDGAHLASFYVRNNQFTSPKTPKNEWAALLLDIRYRQVNKQINKKHKPENSSRVSDTERSNQRLAVNGFWKSI